MRGGAAAAMGQTPLPAGARTRAQPAARSPSPHSLRPFSPANSLPYPRPRSYDYGEQYLEVNAALTGGCHCGAACCKRPAAGAAAAAAAAAR